MKHIHDAIERDLLDVPPPPSLPTLRARRARRRRRTASAFGSATIALVALVALVIARQSPQTRVLRVTLAAPSTSRAVPTTTPTVTFTTGVAAPVDPDAPEPDTFFASIGGGHERTASVNTRTGAPGPALTPASQLLVRFSPDLRTIYYADFHGCGRVWTAVDAATGASHPVFRDLPDPDDIGLSPDGRKIAYVKSLGAYGQGCRGEALVVRDLRSGAERSWTFAGADTGTITNLTWSPDSTHVAYTLDQTGASGMSSTTEVLDINRGRTLLDGVHLAASSPGCWINVPHFRPGTNLVVAAENCTNVSASIVDFDATTGRRVDARTVSTGPYFGIIDLGVDASGSHVIYVLSGATGDVYTLEGTQPVLRLRDAYQVAW
jgi:WD40 repeat protein